MKKFSACMLLLFFIYFTSNHVVLAQIKIATADIKKLLLSTTEGGLDGGITVKMEILNEQGNWSCYQTKYDDFNVSRANKGEKASIINTERKQISLLSKMQITDFLSSVSTIKTYNDSTFSITTKQLLADMPKKLKDPSKANIAKFAALVTNASVKNAKRQVIREISVYDWGKICTIDIVKANGDTLKMATNYLHITMLPWTVNGLESYDTNINAFFMAAMGNEKYPNREVLNINNLEDCLYNYLEGNKLSGTIKVLKPEGYLIKY